MALTDTLRTMLARGARFLHPNPKVAGLEITESSIRFLLIEEGQNVLTISSRIPPGVVQDGKIHDRKAFAAALKDIHKKVTSHRSHAIPVVFLLPPLAVFIQPFALPYLTGAALEEAARLNLAILSPIDFKRAYAGWQVLSPETASESQIELLGAFVEREVVDAFIAVAGETGFSVVAVEFPSLAVARVITEMGSAIGAGTPHLIVRLTAEGIEMSIIRNANLYFNEFTPWHGVEGGGKGGTLTSADINTFLGRDVQRILNFHMSRWGEALTRAIIITETFEPQITRLLEDSFSLKIQPLALTQFDRLPALWYPVLGAAYRGTIPRGHDRFVSLTPTSVSEQYREKQLLEVVRRWRNILVALTAFFLVVYVAVDSFLARRILTLTASLAAQSSPQELEAIQVLEAQANEFNAFAELVLQAYRASVPLAPFLETLRAAAGERIDFKKLDIEKGGVSFTADAEDEGVMVAFKNKLLRDSRFSDVLLPPSSIRGNQDGTVTFSASFRIVPSP